MAHRVVTLSLVSAHNLKDVNVFSRMEVYAIASVYGDPSTRRRSKTDRDGARHPTWDPEDTFSFAVPPTAAEACGSGARLHVLLRTERLFGFSDRDVGEVVIPVADLLAGAGACAYGGATEWHCASYQVRKVRCSERRGSSGTLKFSYRFGPVILPPWQRYPLPQSYAPNYQVVYPPPFPGMLPGAGLFGGGFGGRRFSDMPSSDISAYDDAGHRTAPAAAGRIAV